MTFLLCEADSRSRGMQCTWGPSRQHWDSECSYFKSWPCFLLTVGPWGKLRHCSGPQFLHPGDGSIMASMSQNCAGRDPGEVCGDCYYYFLPCCGWNPGPGVG